MRDTRSTQSARGARRLCRAASGFTLIELLVVVAIIAILAAVLFPVFATVRERGRQTACASHIRQLGLAMQQYSQDNDEKFPLFYPAAIAKADAEARLTPEQLAHPMVAGNRAMGTCYTNQSDAVCNDSWFHRGLMPYIKADAFKDACPSKFSHSRTTNGEPESWWSSTGYGYNFDLTITTAGVNSGKSIAALQRPSETMAFMDAGYPKMNRNWTGTDRMTLAYMATYGSGVNEQNCSGYYGGKGRHMTKMVNICYADGHVKAYMGKAQTVSISGSCGAWGNRINVQPAGADIWTTAKDAFWGLG